MVIKEDIFDIDISNYMFPNVREVQSTSAAFMNGPYLISELGEAVLLNSFCLKNGEDAECVQAWVIGNYAFEGCEITDGFFSDYSVPIKIREHAFDSSAFLDIPSENGVKAIGSVIFAYDDDAEEIKFKHLSYGRYVCPENMPIKNVKCAIIDDVTDMDIVIPLPEMVVINNAKCEWSNISSYLNTDRVKSFETIGDSSVCAKNGILYSKDMEYLIKCPKKKTGDIKIPEGVKYIVAYAFFNAEISSVSFPSTLRQIHQDAFRYSELNKIDFGIGLESTGSYGGNSFADCYNLKEVEIPANITKIDNSTFYNCTSLEKVVLHEGLKFIGQNSFMRCVSLKELTIPSSVEYLGGDCFTEIETLIIPKVIDNILYAYSDSSEGNECPVRKLVISSNNNHTIYIPKDISESAKYRLNGDCRFGNLDEELYKYVYCTSSSQDIAYYLYKHNDEFHLSYYDNLKKYLRRVAKSIAVRYLSKPDESDFIEFVKEGFLSNNAINDLLERANKAQKTIAAAYLLSYINAKEQSSAFRL